MKEYLREVRMESIRIHVLESRRLLALILDEFDPEYLVNTKYAAEELQHDLLHVQSLLNRLGPFSNETNHIRFCSLKDISKPSYFPSQAKLQQKEAE